MKNNGLKKYLYETVLKEQIMDNSKDAIIAYAEEAYKDKKKTMALLCKERQESIANVRKPILDYRGGGTLRLDSSYLEVCVRIEDGIVEVTLDNLAKRRHTRRSIYKGKWEDI